ncbi:MAG: molybdopterin molybdotransferase, partial [Actinomycetota bacterium]|nr:molybdopterin molybdotransferase [Actinomycetota bacterium]
GAPVTLEIVATIAAGATGADVTVGPGQAARIMTGAPIPAGADAVVMVELTSTDGEPRDGGRVTVQEAVPTGNHVRHPGEDIEAGAEVFGAGTLLGPGHLGVLANLGLRKVPVFPRVRVGVLSTGDELVNGQIHDSNRPGLLALCRQSQFEPVDLGCVGDDGDVIEAALRDGASDVDAVVTTGGVSAGDFDFVKRILDTQLQVAIKPAKPLAFGLLDDTPVFGLPGNPVSSMVSFELFARPALRQMMGFTGADRFRPTVTGVADEDLRRGPDGKVHFARVRATYDDGDGRWHLRSAGGQGSHQLLALAHANALAVLPDGDGVLQGEPVSLILL